MWGRAHCNRFPVWNTHLSGQLTHLGDIKEHATRVRRWVYHPALVLNNRAWAGMQLQKILRGTPPAAKEEQGAE